MLNRIIKYFALVLLGGTLFACTNGENAEPHTQVPFTHVHLNDVFWAPKIEINRTVSIPSAFQKSEETGRMDNFALAGNIIEGEHQGDFPFDDTDVYKILEGASYTLAVQYDAELDAYLDSLIYLIGIAQEDDGYLYTSITNKCERLSGWYGKGRWDRLNSHELYNCGHLYEAAVAHYQATGKRTLLDIALKNADLVNEEFGPEPGKKKVPSGHPIIEMALVKLYHVTNDEKYLNLARFFIDETGKATDGHELSEYSQDHKPIVEQDEAVGHAVRLGYLYSGVTDVAAIQHDKALMDASKRVWKNVVSKKLYITGGIGQRAQGEGFGDNYELPNMTSYCETCAAISNVYWNYRLFLNEKHAKYFDVLERTLYNGLISGVSLSGDRFFYDNPLESVHNHDRAPWFGCACCPGNVTRFMASVPGYAYSVSNKYIYVNLFAQGIAEIPFKNDTIEISQQTRYPWDGNIKLTFKTVKLSEVPGLKIRIPGWVRNQAVPSDLYHFVDDYSSAYSFSFNGESIDVEIDKGYAVVEREWKPGDVLEVKFPMPVKKIATNSKVANNQNKLAYQRGPVVYCFEDKDNNDAWLFDHFVSANTGISAQYESGLLGGVTTLSMTGRVVKTINGEQVTKPVQLKAVPYYTWNNRGTSNMLVWMPESTEATIIKPLKSPAMDAQCEGSTGRVSGFNDGFTPSSSTDYDKSYFYWWLKNGSKEWVQYNFDQPQTLCSSSVYWLDMTHYDGDFRVPEWWSLEYQTDDGQWLPVKTSDQYGLKLNTYNEVNFEPVNTRSLRLNVKLGEGVSGGIHEWNVD